MTAKYWLYVALHGLIFMAGTFFAFRPDAIARGIGSSLIAAGIAGWVIFLYVFVSSAAADRLALIEAAGLREVFPRRSISIRNKYEERLHKANQAIDVIGYGLRALREDLGIEFPAWAQKAQVRILLIDPDFPNPNSSISDLRDVEEGKPRDSIRQDVRAFVSQCMDLILQNTRFQVRLYQAIPAINYFRVDDEAFWGPFFVGMPSRNAPTFLVGRSGFLFAPLQAHFEKLWSDQFSREVPSEWLADR